jgi:hypothetical protein
VILSPVPDKQALYPELIAQYSLSSFIAGTEQIVARYSPAIFDYQQILITPTQGQISDFKG